MGSHTRVSPLARAAMRVILAAPAGDPADTETIIAALGCRPLRACLVLSRLELSGWVTSEKTGGDRVYRAVYNPQWYAARITEPDRTRPRTAA
jgi:hypothetical protein